jgi:hypothetical protein
MNYNIKYIDELSSTTASQRSKNNRWLAQQGEQTRIEAVKLQTDLVRQHRKQQQGQTVTPEYLYAMHALAVAKMIWAETAQQRKGSKLSDEEFEKMQEIRIDRIKSKKRKKASPKKELIRVRFLELIKKLREKNLSWREISEYIATHHKTKLTHSYIRESFLELTATKSSTPENSQLDNK